MVLARDRGHPVGGLAVRALVPGAVGVASLWGESCADRADDVRAHQLAIRAAYVALRLMPRSTARRPTLSRRLSSSSTWGGKPDGLWARSLPACYVRISFQSSPGRVAPRVSNPRP